MISLFMLLSVICMIIGHIFKIKRWGLFISVYEEPSYHNLLNALALGHTINAILPIRLGDIVRVLVAEKNLKNGGSFALATVFADLYIDTITVGIFFIVCYLIGIGGGTIAQMTLFYIGILLLIIFTTIFSMVFRKLIKKIIHIVSGVFNEKIEFRLLYVTYLCIASLKDIWKNISRIKFLGYTFAIWSGYLTSYYFFARVLETYGYNSSTIDVFAKLFSGMNLFYVNDTNILLWGVFLLLPLAWCWILSLIINRVHYTKNVSFELKKFRAVLPQMNQSDRLSFLRTYYEETSREHLQAYLGINKDAVILEDHSAGSNASTVLIMKSDGNIYYRKYAFDQDRIKLQQQVEWIKSHQKDIPLPFITDIQNAVNYMAYDMHSYRSAVGLFKYIHTMPIDSSWIILERALKDIETKLHLKNVRNADNETICQYIKSKVLINIRIIESSRYIKNLEQNDYVIVNGNRLYTLKFYYEALKEEHLLKIFQNDKYSNIHGDLTIENIICIQDETEIDAKEYKDIERPETYYFIDPNTENIHNSPFLDYAKLLQSLHGYYEFLMTVTEIKLNRNQISFMNTRSESYKQLYDKYRNYLHKKFSRDEMISIYYHEVVHWLRLMPYKIRKNEKLAIVFYTGLLSVMNDVWEMENGTED